MFFIVYIIKENLKRHFVKAHEKLRLRTDFLLYNNILSA
jgi:hypothetical protein